MNQSDKSNPFFDIDTYINNLEKTIEHQKNIIESLKNEIRTQRKEIGALREQSAYLLDNDKPPHFNSHITLDEHLK